MKYLGNEFCQRNISITHGSLYNKRKNIHISRKKQALILAKERLFMIKTREVMDDLHQITLSIEKIGAYGFDNSRELEQIDLIQSNLGPLQEKGKFKQIVSILTKYLNGMRKFSISMNIQGILFYKKLFRCTLIAITRELKSLDEIYIS